MDGSDHDKTGKFLTKQNLWECDSIPTSASLGRNQVKFFSLILSRHGISPGPSKIRSPKEAASARR